MPSFPTVAIVMAEIDFTLERFLIDVKFVCSIDVLFLAEMVEGLLKGFSAASPTGRAQRWRALR